MQYRARKQKEALPVWVWLLLHRHDQPVCVPVGFGGGAAPVKAGAVPGTLDFVEQRVPLVPELLCNVLQPRRGDLSGVHGGIVQGDSPCEETGMRTKSWTPKGRSS